MNGNLLIFATMVTGLTISCRGDYNNGPQGTYGWGPMMHYGYGYGGMFMWIFLIIIIGLLIYFILRSRNMKDHMPAPGESALDILKKRYAKGEIGKEDYDRMKKDLES